MSAAKKTSPDNVRRLKGLLLESDNRVCADCSAPDPKWASANIGVFICLKCCGVHRSLGTHISKVLSVTLDEWSDDEIESMIEVGGNSSANSIYEAFLPEGFAKPGPEASNDERKKFIRSKYELQEFLKPSLRITSGKSSLQTSLSKKIIDTFRSSNSNSLNKTIMAYEKVVVVVLVTNNGFCAYALRAHESKEGMVEFLGLLKVKVIEGKNLAVRDMLSSDPYVILNLGHQRVQTQVISSNLNPVWNEELMLSVPEKFGAVKLQVYDQDTFSADDIMGEAEIDIQPMITAAMALGDAGLFGNIQIGKWLKSSDNALMEDSTVNIVDGKVKQEIALKLQNVESGEVYLELEWMPLDH